METKQIFRSRVWRWMGLMFVALVILAGGWQPLRSADAAGLKVDAQASWLPPAKPASASSVVAGYAHACEIKANGTAACWGSQTERNASPPGGTFTRLSAGWLHNCGVKTDGTVACWGFDRLGQATPPGGTFKEIAVGALHSCGIKTDGTLACWGYDFVGQASPPTGTFTQVTAGSIHSCALRTNGTLACWGENLEGRTDAPGGIFTQISAGNHHTCGVRDNGTVECWGNNGDGRSTSPGGTFTQVSAGAKHTCGLKGDGTLACWGANENGQTSAPTGMFAQVSVGGVYSCARTSDGFIRCWGGNDYGQAPVPAINPTTLPNGRVGDVYHQTLNVTADMYNVLAPVYALASGNLPNGLSLGNDGSLTGMPTTAGSFDFTVAVVDANAFRAQQAFTVVIAKGPLLVQDSDISAEYNGWRGEANGGASGGTYRESNTKNDTVTFKFTGKVITWIGRKGPDMGKAQVTIDGVDKGTIDLYAASEQWQFKKTFRKLSNAKHTLVVKVLGSKNKLASDTTVGVDAFKVGTKVTEDTAAGVRFDTWTGRTYAAASGGSFRTSKAAGAQVGFPFTGTAVEWLTAKGPKYGKARVLIDGVDKGVFDQYAANQQWQVAVAFTGLSDGAHTLEIQVLGTKRAASTGKAVVVDALRLAATRASIGFSKVLAAPIVAARTATIPVACDNPATTEVDEGVSGLIDAINVANNEDVTDPANHYGPDILDLTAGCTYKIKNAYTTMPEAGDPIGLPLIVSDITLNGHGATITREGSEQFIFLYVGAEKPEDAPEGSTDAPKLVVNDLTFTNASAFRGSCIWNVGTLEVNNSVFTGNHADWSGPTIQNGGSTFLNNVTATNNTSGYFGSGFWGGAYDDGHHISQVELKNVTITHNDTGVFNEHSGLMDLYNVTIAENSGTALYNAERGVVTINNSTISGNGDGIGGGSPVALTNTIVANNSGSNCWGSITDNGNNLDSGNSCGFSAAGSMHDTDPKLDPLGLLDNGGPTKTIALLPGSLAIDHGKISACAAEPVNNLDQRGVSRTKWGACDIGAYESVKASCGETFTLTKIGTNKTDKKGASEIVAYDPAAQRIYITNVPGNKIDILDIRDPANPSLVSSIGISGQLTSVAFKNGVLGAAVKADPAKGRAKFYDGAGNTLADVEVGYGPDMITFTPDGKYALTANEGEASDTDNPVGSISLIDLSNGAAALTDANVTTMGFEGITVLDPEVRWTTGTSFAQDAEPEYITVSPDSATAWVTLQENNSFAAVDLTTKTITQVIPLGAKDHGAAGNGVDGSDDELTQGMGKINIRTWNCGTNCKLEALYQPDGIAAFRIDGVTYLAAANEGANRGSDDKKRIRDLTLDPKFPTTWKQDKNIGKLEVWGLQAPNLNAQGFTPDPDGDGDIDNLYAFGGRSFAIWKTDGTPVYESGDQIEQKIAVEEPARFNFDPDEYASPAEEYGFDERSDNAGSEPEGIVVGWVNGCSYAFIGLEQQCGILSYEVTDPANPVFKDWVKNIDYTTLKPDAAPEGIVFIPAWLSPNGKPLLVVANEGVKTKNFEQPASTTIYEITAQ